MTAPRSGLRVWLRTVRPATLSLSVAPVLVGAALAAAEDALSVPVSLAALAGAALLQIGTNLCNDYGDFVRGADGPSRVGPERALAQGWLTPRAVLTAAILSFVLATACGAYLVTVGGWPIVVIGVLGILSGVAYTTGPWPLAYLGIAEPFVLVFFGPVAVAATYWLQTGRVDVAVILAGLGPGALATAVLVVNNHRDRQSDERAGKRTLAVRFGPTFARAEYTALLAVAFMAPVAATLLDPSHWPWLGTWLLLPPAVRLVQAMRRREGAMAAPLLGATARMTLVYCVVLAICVAAGGGARMSAFRLERPMVLRGAAAHSYELPWRAEARRGVRRGWLLSVDAAGARGWGDAAPWPGFGAGDLQTVGSELASVSQRLVDVELTSVADAVRVSGSLRLGPEATCAVELALLDLLGRAAGRSLADLLAKDAGAPGPAPVAVPSAVGVTSPADATSAVAAGARVLKTKLAAADRLADIERLRAIRAAVPSVELRADANGAWHDATPTEAAALLARLRPLQLGWLEQPWRAGADEGEVRGRWLGAGVPIAADESVVHAAQARDAAATLRGLEGVDVLVLKPMFLGGVIAALELARAALASGRAVSMSCAWESAVGRAGTAHAAAALAAFSPRQLRAAGLDAPLARDVASLQLSEGAVVLPEGFGLGVLPRLGAGGAA